MADVTPLKQNLQEEDLKSGAAASESTMDKVGSSVNFWNNYYEGGRFWIINGPYDITSVPDNGIDGWVPCPFDMEIFGVFFAGFESGTSGTSEIDILKYPVGGGSPVTIFTTRPAAPASVGDDFIIQTEEIPSYSIVRQTVGTTAPVLVSTQLDKGDALKLNWVTKAVGGAGLTVGLFMRPRS
jgi:hypothetical protein